MRARVRDLVYAAGTWAWRRILVWWVIRETRKARVRREREAWKAEEERDRWVRDQWVRIDDWAEARRQWARDARDELERVRARRAGAEAMRGRVKR